MKQKKTKNAAGKGKRLVCLLLVLSALAVFMVWQQKSIVPEEIEVFSQRLPHAFDGLRISIVSDVHGREFGTDNSRLLEAVEAQRPDLIAITGDLIESEKQMEMVPALARGLCAIAPTYYITGNHEWAIRMTVPLMALLEECGVTALENEALLLEREGQSIVLAGIHDPNGRADQKSPAQLAQEIRAGEGEPFVLLLAHRNVKFQEYAGAGYDVTLAGHGHGGLIRLPGTDGLIGVDRTLFPTWTNGRYELDGSQMVVSRGLGNVFFSLRLFNRPHLPLVILRAA